MTTVDRDEERRLEGLSPFELKNRLIELAGENEKANALAMVNAGRGNPNWTATAPRDAFFLLGQFAVTETRRDWDEFASFGGMPQSDGIAARLGDYLKANASAPGAEALGRYVAYGTDTLGFDADDWVGELADAIIGDHYPVPDRMLVHAEKVVHAYLDAEMGGAPKGGWDLYAVEGGTAAMCYLFDSAQVNGLLHRGDRIALMVPIFTPYLEIPLLDRYAFDIVSLEASTTSEEGIHTWQYPDAEIDKLKDPSIKALFLVNPSNPPSVKLAEATLERIRDIVANHNPGLTIITDDVYGTFTDGFTSLMSSQAANTIGVYSFSKYFGCTGWRLGVIAIAKDNVFDQRIAALEETRTAALRERYASITLEPEKLKFIDRIVADSRDVALNHTAGLSTPQQVQMVLFSLHCLTDAENQYKKDCQAVIARRLKQLVEGLDVPYPDDPEAAHYYVELDLLSWAERNWGPEFADWMQVNYEPVDPIFRLAQEESVVLLNGGGFDGPEWSVRVSMANLRMDAYRRIGAALRRIGEEYHEAFQNSRR
ncbi:bifunctional aspartate transaminase/aspartate 4-decarboxylase [Glycomyces artemisiae]|uniref:Aspartate 4-decarboxylase n=1 Tax=Glycomyces artemisiae TaxID=1076443 RepID=A0A2T0UA99_9ACTN|nr:bifunctional aspartate transaminase/aspartate 4-decarboxylase [Glycomyces artemisiae]PRY54788.1 aspartate 4-decarboxylase [Glycomyces artemisiae]